VLSRQPVGRGDEPVTTVAEMEMAVADNPVRTRLRPKTMAGSRGFRPGVVFPVAAAVAYATSDLLVKGGLDSAAEPAFGAAVSTGAALFVWLLAHAFPTMRRRFRVGPATRWLALSGVLTGTAILLLFNALKRGDVSVVTPVVASQPLFVFLFSTLILRHLEQLDGATLLGGICVVVGTVAVSI
jgi:bacterial/archaeal transporter family protein